MNLYASNTILIFILLQTHLVQLMLALKRNYQMMIEDMEFLDLTN